MRRSSLIAVIALLLLSLAGGSVVSAHGGNGSSGSGSSGHHGGSQKQVELRVRASSKAHQAGRIKIRVKAKHARHGTALTGQAVVHFASGDVTVDLLPKSHGRQLRARVPVAADAALGPITIDVTVTLDGVAQPSVTLTSTVGPPSLDD